MTEGSKLIPPERSSLPGYYAKDRGKLLHAGVVIVTHRPAEPEWKVWDREPYNPLTSICTTGEVDGAVQQVVPVKLNSEPVLFAFDTEDWTKVAEINETKPAIVFFMGNDNWSYGMRFATFEERDEMLATFGADLALLSEDLLGHN